MGRTYSDKVVAGTPMKGAHVRILRGYIQQDLNAASVSFTWSWSNWSAGQDAGQPVRVVYFKEMRDAIQALWNSKGRGLLPGWTQETPQGLSTGHSTPTVIRATHVTDLRAWLNQYENNHPPLTQGIDSKSYDPLQADFAVIDNVDPNDWTGDVRKISQQPLFVRLEIKGRKHPDLGENATVDFTGDDYTLYREAFSQYKARSMVMFPVFTHQFFKPPGSDTSTESYRQQFASRVRDLLLHMKNHGNLLADPSNNNIVSAIIWNEPNVSSAGFMTQENFARLLHRCWKTIEDDPNFSGNRPQLYWAGIFSVRDENYSTDFPWVREIYESLSATHLMDNESVKFPWVGINIHIHRTRDGHRIHDMLKTVRRIQSENGDPGSMIVGEWGVIGADGPNDLSDIYGDIVQNDFAENDRYLPDIMFYFSHHIQDETEDPDQPVVWGFRRYDFYTRSPDQSQVRFSIEKYDDNHNDIDAEARPLRNRYASILHGQTLSIGQ